MDQSVQNDEEQKKQQEAYKKIKILGQGSMGRAYLVQSATDSQLYVMKRINIGFLSPQQKQNAMRQAKLHSVIAHDNVIGFKEIYHTTKQKLCIVMEYAEGGDLDAFIREQNGKQLSQELILELFSQICFGLRAIHQKKIVHRDLKGANIFLTKQNKVKIGDFGISKVIDQTVQASKSFVGTPYYLSPEMVQGKPYSTKADIWALGVILYHLCAQKLPFQANSLPFLALKILKGSFPPLTGPYSRQLKTLILNLLQVNAKKRPTIDEIILKPILSKYLPKDQVIRPTIIPSIKPKTKQPVVKKTIKPKPKQPKLSEQEKKMEEKQKKQQALQKRNNLRKQMKEDLKKKRKQIQKQTLQSGKTLQVVSESKKMVQKPTKKDEQVEQKNVKKDVPKPWKTQKNPSKKQIQVELYLPQDKPKPQIKEEEVVILPENDFKVQIFVSSKTYNEYKSQKELQQKKQQLEQVQQQQQQYEQEQQQQQQSQIVEQQINEHNILDILDRVNGAKLAVEGLGNKYEKEICLYEDSQNFDTTQFSPQQKQELFSKEEDDSMKYINNSQNLQECRLLLEQRLGQQNFIKSYNILNQHLQESSEKRMKGQELDDYTFNREIIRMKLPFLQEEEFNKYIILLYTLIILQDEEMKKNLQIDDDSQK